MTSMLAFDTLAFAKKLRGAGYTDTQAEALAEAQVEVFRQMLESTLATKDDIKDLTEIAQVRTELKGEIAQVMTELKGEIAQLRTELKGEIAQVRTELKGEIERTTKDMKIWFGTMLVLAVTVLATLDKVL